MSDLGEMMRDIGAEIYEETHGVSGELDPSYTHRKVLPLIIEMSNRGWSDKQIEFCAMCGFLLLQILGDAHGSEPMQQRMIDIELAGNDITPNR